MCTTTDYCREHGVNHAVAEHAAHPPTQAEAELFWSDFPCCASGERTRPAESPAEPFTCADAQALRTALTEPHSKPWVHLHHPQFKGAPCTWAVTLQCCGEGFPNSIVFDIGEAHDLARAHVAEVHTPPPGQSEVIETPDTAWPVFTPDPDIIGNDEGNEKIRKKDQAAAVRLGYALDPITDEIIWCGCECHAGQDRS